MMKDMGLWRCVLELPIRRRFNFSIYIINATVNNKGVEERGRGGRKI
jgi:hypothetical protein